MLAELPYALIIIGAVLVGLWISNILYDLKVPHYISRKVGHSAGGLAYLSSVFLFSSAWWPIILSFSFGLILWIARFRHPRTFRGVGGSGRSPHSLSEVWFAWIAVPVFAVGWLWLNQPFLAVSCLLFMAWGDCVTGLVRSEIYGKPVKGLWGSLAMLLVCLVISWAFIKPFWIGAIVSVVATITEWSFGDVGLIKWADDNWAIPVVSLVFLLITTPLIGS
jgi:phytol kinase